MLTIDGSDGEGGGQILRTSLSLAMVTGMPFRIDRIRAGRKKPGLLRQHLTCVRAAEQISNARVTGAELGSKSLVFEPQEIRGGVFELAIGSAGSTTLVFQTVWPALIRAAEKSRVVLSGGTHNPSAPTFDYLAEVYLPLLRRMGLSIEAKLMRPGFYPAGGGRWQATVHPAGELMALFVEERGEIEDRQVRADVAGLPFDVATREIATATRLLSWPETAGTARTVDADGHGNVVSVTCRSAHVADMFVGFGTRDRSAETVAEGVVDEVRSYLIAGVPVGPHLADQLLVPMALCGAGAFVTQRPTAHTLSNIAVIEKFLPVEFTVEDLDADRFRISASA